MNSNEDDFSIEFKMDQENVEKLLKVTIQGLMEKCDRLAKEVRHARNELCYQCGRYRDAHNGACDDCRFRHGGEWEADLE